MKDFENSNNEKRKNSQEILALVSDSLSEETYQDSWSITARKEEREKIRKRAQEAIEKIKSWKLALSRGRSQEVLKNPEDKILLKQLMTPSQLHTLILMRGDNNEFIEFIPEAFELITQKYFSGKHVIEIEIKAILRILNENNFSQEVINYLMSAYFHLGKKEEFERLGQSILENESSVNPLAVLTCKMDINSLKVKEGESPAFDPIQLSQEAFQKGDFSLALKIIYGGLLRDI
jgi:hypothetical protein